VHIFIALSLLFACGCQNKKPSQTHDTETSFCLKNYDFPRSFSKRNFYSLISKGRYQDASRYVNKILGDNMRNPALHILNGLVYERMHAQKPTTFGDLSYVAYRSAKDLDRSIWFSHHMLGHSALKKRLYAEAQKHFLNAVLLHKSPESFYGLACASYAVRDLGAAKMAVDMGLKLDPKEPKMLAAGSLVYAALDCTKQANVLLGRYKNVSSAKAGFMQSRISSWARAYDAGRRGHFCPANLETGETKDNEDSDNVSKEDESEPSIVIDAHLAFHDTTSFEKKGDNVLLSKDLSGKDSPLSVVLGPGGLTGDITMGDGNSGTWTENTSYNMSMDGVSYALNIANARTKTLEVYYRPSVETTVNKPSYIASGPVINAAPEGGQVVKLDLGEKLEVMVTRASRDSIEMNVMLSLSELKERESIYTSLEKQTLSVSQLKMGTTVRTQPGKTVVVGGLTWERSGSVKQGIPLLGNVPFLQYFTSQRGNAWDRVKVYCFLTPRLVKKMAAVKKVPYVPSVSGVCRSMIANGMGGETNESRLNDIFRHLNSSILLSHYRSDDLVYKPFQERSIDILGNVDKLKTFLFF
jgi:hypothetical protein